MFHIRLAFSKMSIWWNCISGWKKKRPWQSSDVIIIWCTSTNFGAIFELSLYDANHRFDNFTSFWMRLLYFITFLGSSSVRFSWLRMTFSFCILPTMMVIRCNDITTEMRTTSIWLIFIWVLLAVRVLSNSIRSNWKRFRIFIFVVLLSFQIHNNKCVKCKYW